MENYLLINTQDMIECLFRASKRKSFNVETLYQFESFIRRHLSKANQKAYWDLSSDSIAHLVLFSEVYDLLGNVVIAKGIVPERNIEQEVKSGRKREVDFLEGMAEQFVQMYIN